MTPPAAGKTTPQFLNSSRNRPQRQVVDLQNIVFKAAIEPSVNSLEFASLARDVEPRLERIKSLAGTFKTSLTATGMKFVDINKHECILVLSTNKAVAWSKQQGKRSGLRIEKGMRLHPESLAFHVAEPAGETGPDIVKSEAWITHNSYERQIEITEQSWALDGYNSVLTMLVVADVDGAADDDMVQHYEIKNVRE